MATPDDTPLPDRLTKTDLIVGIVRCGVCGRIWDCRQTEADFYVQTKLLPRCCGVPMTLHIADQPSVQPDSHPAPPKGEW